MNALRIDFDSLNTTTLSIVGVGTQEGAEQGSETATTGATEGETTPPPSGLSSMMFPLLLIGVIFWFVVIGPERKARRAREAMLGAIKKGDKVMTNGGLFGTVASIHDDEVSLQVADGVRLRFARSAVQGLVNPEPAEDDSSD